MAAKKQLVFYMERERETKNKQRFKEEGDQSILDTSYLGKKHDKTLGEPERIKVTIEPA
jgi:hypothetical protein